MPKKQYIQTNQTPQYDAQTMAFLQSAKQSIAKNHGLAIDRDPAEIMKQNNRKLHEAAQTLASKRAMVKQQSFVKKSVVAQPNTSVQPVLKQQPFLEEIPETPNDTAMQKVGYDAYMQSLMGAPEEPDEEPLVELSDMQPSTPEVAMQTVPQQAAFIPNIRRPPNTVRYDDSALQTTESVVKPHIESAVEPIVPQKPKQNVALAQPRIFTQTNVTNYSDIRGLPSEGMAYELPLMGQALTFMDVLMMNHMDSENITSTVNTLMNRRLTGGWETGFSAENILSCDEGYLMHWLRASTVDDPMPYESPDPDKFIPFKCPKCGKVAQTPEEYQKIQVNFNNMEFKLQGNLHDIMAKHANGCHTFYLEDGRECDVYLRRRYHETETNKTVAQYLKDTGTEMPYEMRVLLHHAVVVEIQGIDNIVDKINYLGNLSYSAANHFLDEVNSASLITDITAKVICPFCKEEVIIPYPFRLDVYISSL